MTILKFIIKKNKRKLIKEYLQLFIKNSYHLQYKFNVKLYIDKFIYNPLINTY